MDKVTHYLEEGENKRNCRLWHEFILSLPFTLTSQNKIYYKKNVFKSHLIPIGNNILFEDLEIIQKLNHVTK